MMNPNAISLWFRLVRTFALAVSIVFSAASLCAQSVSPDGRFEIANGPDGTVELRIRGGERLAAIAGAPSDAAVQVRWSPDGAFVSLSIQRHKYTDLLVYALVVTPRGAVDAVSAVEVALPVLPAGSILERFPRDGKPPGAESLRLDSMSIARAEWSGPQLVITAHLNCVNDSNGDVSWRYTVDYVLMMPIASPAAANKPTASQTVLNVVLEKTPAIPAAPRPK